MVITLFDEKDDKWQKYWDFLKTDICRKMNNDYLWIRSSISLQLCWFQTSLPLAALPLRRVIIACCFRVAALSGHAALALSPSGIAPELNRIQLSAICHGGQSGKGYRSIGKTLLAAWSSLCGKWRSCSNIINKAAMRRAAS